MLIKRLSFSLNIIQYMFIIINFSRFVCLYVKEQVKCLLVLLTGECFYSRPGLTVLYFTKRLDSFKKILPSKL